MNGIDASATIKAESDVPVIFISGYGDPEYIEKAKQIEPFGYVMKPFDKMEINAFIEIALHKKEMELKLKDANERLKQTNLALHKKIEEQNQTEQILEESKKLLAKAQKIAHLGNWNWNIITNEISWSDELYRIHGISPQSFEANYEACLERIHPDDLPYFKDLTERALKDKKPYSAHYRIVRPDKEIRIVHEQGEVSQDTNGNPTNLFGIVQDITDQKQAEQALRQSEQKFQLLFDNAPMGYQSLDENGCFLDVNQAWLDILGYERHEVLGKWFGDFLPPDLLDIFRKRFQKNIQSRELIPSVEFPLVRKDGSIVFVDYMARIGRDEEGHFVRTHCAFSDITEKKRSEQALRESEEKLRRTFEQAAVGIAHVAPDGRWLRVNQKLCDIVGYSREELLDKTFQDITFAEDLDGDLEYVRQMLAGEIQTYSMEKRYIRKNGSLVWINLTVSMVYNATGDTDYFISVIEDINTQKQAEEKFFSLYNTMTEGVCRHEVIYDESGDAVDYRIIDINPSYERILGLKKEDVQNKAGSIIYDADPPPYLNIYAEVAQTGNPVRFEAFFPPMDKHFLVSAFSPEKDHFATIFQDITERKQAEEALKKNRNFIDKIINTAPNLVYIYDLVLKCNVYSNDGIKKLLGFGVNEIQKMGEALFPTLLHPDDLGKVIAHQALLKKSKDGEVFEINYRMKNKQGAYRILRSWDTVFTKGDDGTVQQIIGLAADVTDQIKAEESLKFEKERARQYLDVAGVILIALDKDRKVTLINPKGCEILGYPQEKIIGKDWFDNFLFSENLEAIEGVFEQIMSGFIEPVAYYENPVKTRSGDNRLIAWHNSILKDADGNITGLFSSGEDITEQKRAETEKELLRKQLAHAQKMEAIGTLAGGIAHDFNNILGIILGNAELSMDDIPEWNPARQNLDEVRKACLRAKEVVTQILSFSRKTETEEKQLNITSIVHESLKLLRASIPTSIEIRRNIASDVDNIFGDSTEIHQIMMNLCTNAAHAMEDEKGTLEITVENRTIDESAGPRYPELRPGPHVQLSISDTGCGISPEVIDRIFDPYFTTKDVGKGTGLGLSIAHGIVKNHNGRISVESKIGKGSTFRILFPSVEGKIKEKSKEFKELPGGTETILFVDDEGAMVNLNQQRLERLGYKVIPKTDPSEALAFFLADPDQIDLIITDMTMPQMTGDRLAEEILKIRSDMPIILCTGYNSRISEERAKEIGIRKYIEKPTEAANLARSVREVLDDKSIVSP